MGVGFLGDAFLCHLPRTCLNAMAVDVPLLCCTPCTAARVSAAHFWLLLLWFVRVTHIPYGQTGRCSYVAVLMVGTLLTAVLLFYG